MARMDPNFLEPYDDSRSIICNASEASVEMKDSYPHEKYDQATSNVPTERVIRFLLQMGYSDYLLAELDQKTASGLMKLLADNYWQPVEFRFPGGETEHPQGRRINAWKIAPLPACLAYCKGVLSQADHRKKEKQAERKRNQCEFCGKTGKRVRAYFCNPRNRPVKVCGNCHGKIISDALANEQSPTFVTSRT